MATLVARPRPVRSRSRTPSRTRLGNASYRIDPIARPSSALSKHVTRALAETSLSPTSNKLATQTPPCTPLISHFTPDDVQDPILSPLFPPTGFERLDDELLIYRIEAAQLHDALNEYAAMELADPSKIFPYLYGIHPENIGLQRFFGDKQYNGLCRPPSALRCISIVKAGDDLSHSKLRGAVKSTDFLENAIAGPEPAQDEDAARGKFLDVDPKSGYTLRPFHIQVAKIARVSDIIVYKDDSTSIQVAKETAMRCAYAQQLHRKQYLNHGWEPVVYSVFVLTTPWVNLEREFPELVAIDSVGKPGYPLQSFMNHEQAEMLSFGRPTEITRNVWLGTTPTGVGDQALAGEFDLLIEASENPAHPFKPLKQKIAAFTNQEKVQRIEVPASGSMNSPAIAHVQLQVLLDIVKWMYKAANPDSPYLSKIDGMSDEESDDEEEEAGFALTKLPVRPARLLLHCADGYTETSLVALAYLMFSEHIPAHTAWTRLHVDRKRDFFAYRSDLDFLTRQEQAILTASPLHHLHEKQSTYPMTKKMLAQTTSPSWFTSSDGSLPSRITPYMYLGNVTHANNWGLLAHLGIGQVLSIGEAPSWMTVLEKRDKVCRALGMKEGDEAEGLLYLSGVQDNGTDPLKGEFQRCLEFIERGRQLGTATLVHCRVGVSRSATICIAEVMSTQGLDFAQAYCYVRARRLNVIIQPHLRFVWELMQWEADLKRLKGLPIRRDREWAEVCAEIARLNAPYIGRERT